MPNYSKITPLFLIQVQKHSERSNFTNSATIFYNLTGNISSIMEIKNLVYTVHKLSRSTNIQKLVTYTSNCKLKMTHIQRLRKHKLLEIPTETSIQSKFAKVFVNRPLPPTLWRFCVRIKGNKSI